MPPYVLHFLDYFCILFHAVVVVFNVVGWIWRKTRRAHLVVILLTAFSWFVLGYFYGWGYCIMTDWHWRVREQLGYQVQAPSFIKWAIDSILGIDSSEEFMNNLIAIVFFAAMGLSFITNFRDWRASRAKR